MSTYKKTNNKSVVMLVNKVDISHAQAQRCSILTLRLILLRGGFFFFEI